MDMDKHNISFVCELPRCSEPRYICGLIKITRLLFVLSSFALIMLLLFAASVGYELKAFNYEYQYVLYVALLIMLVPIILSFLSIFRMKHALLMPTLFFQIFIIMSYKIIFGYHIYTMLISNGSFIFKKEKTHALYWFIFTMVFVPFYWYYIAIIILTFKYLKNNKSTEKFIARQKMFDDVCLEMIEEEEENEIILRNRELLHQLSFRYDDDSEISESFNTAYYYDGDFKF